MTTASKLASLLVAGVALTAFTVQAESSFNSITSASANLEITENNIVKMDIISFDNKAAGFTAAGTLFAKFQASSSNNQDAVAVAWAGNYLPAGNDGVIINGVNNPRNLVILKIDFPGKQMINGTRWLTAWKPTMAGQVVLASETYVTADTYDIRLEATSFKL
ncbi:hypothetical protein [Serratia sp. UGAL515B_01]|uniref:hypothetical protein n=1 Tax=Serratia sp. UGAL515B_01 TaxID=2986763 RepID=UPI002954D97B|nr:hypothetical protein [Serratia sp. UGAL515B_01]WON76400.1 hypothetical protein OK023_14405 [Serratia sp. UGAL515B_01]